MLNTIVHCNVIFAKDDSKLICPDAGADSDS